MAGDNTSDMSALTNLPNFMRFPAPIPKIGDDALEDLNDYTTSDIIVRVNDKQLYFLHWPYLERTEYFAPQRAFSEGTAKLIEVHLPMPVKPAEVINLFSVIYYGSTEILTKEPSFMFGEKTIITTLLNATYLRMDELVELSYERLAARLIDDCERTSLAKISHFSYKHVQEYIIDELSERILSGTDFWRITLFWSEGWLEEDEGQCRECVTRLLRQYPLQPGELALLKQEYSQITQFLTKEDISKLLDALHVPSHIWKAPSSSSNIPWGLGTNDIPMPLPFHLDALDSHSASGSGLHYAPTADPYYEQQ